MDYLVNSVSLIAGSGLDLLAKSRKKVAIFRLDALQARGRLLSRKGLSLAAFQAV